MPTILRTGFNIADLRQDCLTASLGQTVVMAKFKGKRIAVTGGTGFVGSWIAEMVAALNDEYSLGISLDLYARHASSWASKYPHLSERNDIFVRVQDVRSPFTFEKDVNYIIHAAGIPDNRVHASDPVRVEQTTVFGTANVLDSASQLGSLEHLINLSSCLVNGAPTRPGAIAEHDYFPVGSGQLHQVYADSKRASESLTAVYRSQFRLTLSIMRPFTFIGPYQGMDRPWALNSFLNDAIQGRNIRVHGDGSARRSYLYGSDAAWWLFTALVKGSNGAIYNLGGSEVISHVDLIKLICNQSSLKHQLIFNIPSLRTKNQDDLFPDLSYTTKQLGVSQTCSLVRAIEKTWRWNSELS